MDPLKSAETILLKVSFLISVLRKLYNFEIIKRKKSLKEELYS